MTTVPGQAFLWNLQNLGRRLRVLYLGVSIDVDVHQHHLTQICVGLEEPILTRGADGRVTEHRAVVLHADEPHRISTASNSPIAVVYLGSEASALKPPIPDGRRPVDLSAETLHALREAHDRKLPVEEATTLADRLVAESLGPVEERFEDDRVRTVVERLREDPVTKHSAASLAESVELSPRRLSSLFRRDVGMPIRRYVVSLRLRLAIGRAVAGSSLTEAAHWAGFTDLAHLSHAFRDSYGISPSSGLDPSFRPRFVLVDDDAP